CAALRDAAPGACAPARGLRLLGAARGVSDAPARAASQTAIRLGQRRVLGRVPRAGRDVLLRHALLAEPARLVRAPHGAVVDPAPPAVPPRLGERGPDR